MSLRRHRVLRSPESHRPTYPAEILPLMQALLATLADLDFAHDCAMEKAQTSILDPDMKALAVSTLQERHREHREPYVRQLAALQEQIRAGFVHSAPRDDGSSSGARAVIRGGP